MRVVGDIECNGLYDDVTTIWCAVFKDINTGEIYRFVPHTVEQIPSFLSGVDILWMHNGAQYDLPVIEKILGYKYEGLLIDTLAVSRMERPKRLSHSLESWGETLGFPKQEFDQWDQYSENMLEYCENDVELTRRVAIYLGCTTPLVRHKSISSLFSHLFRQEQYGWRIDTDHLSSCLYMIDRWKQRIVRTIEPKLPIKVELGTPVNRPFKRDRTLSKATIGYCTNAQLNTHHIGGPFSRVNFRPLSLDKPGEIKDYLLELGWKPELWNHNKQGIKTSPKMSVEDPFDGINSKLGKLIVKYVQCKHREAMFLGWQRKLDELQSNRLPSKVAGLAVTSRARHSVIANIPRPTSFLGRWARRAFIAEPGKVLVGADAASCQLRMLAARMGDQAYIKRILSEDPHAVHMEIAEHNDRDDMKRVIYALFFGASDARLERVIRKPPAPIKRKLLENLPALNRCLRDMRKKWEGTAKVRINRWGKSEYYDGHIESLDGRPIYCSSAHKVLMSYLQSDEAILMQYAYNMYHNKLKREGLVYGRDYGVLCWYHDEFATETLPLLATTIGEMKCASIREAGQYLGLACPMDGEYKVGESWMEIH